jgi:putative oxidoreductase
MTMFESPVGRTPDSVDLIRTWVPRIAMSLFFLSFGSQKFTDAMWVRIFQQIGFGDWFRYVTGTLQIAGALLLLIPATALFGAAVLAMTMIGAMVAWIFFLSSPGSAVFPGIILAMLIAVGMRTRRP